MFLHDLRPAEPTNTTAAGEQGETIGSWGRGSSPAAKAPLGESAAPNTSHDSAPPARPCRACAVTLVAPRQRLATPCQTHADVSSLHPFWLRSLQNGLRRIQTGGVADEKCISKLCSTGVGGHQLLPEMSSHNAPWAQFALYVF